MRIVVFGKEIVNLQLIRTGLQNFVQLSPG